jgi:DNA-binding transcriptional LysR family regulator
LVVVAAPIHPLARLHRVGIEDLSRHQYVAREAGSGPEEFAGDLFGIA